MNDLTRGLATGLLFAAAGVLWWASRQATRRAVGRPVDPDIYPDIYGDVYLEGPFPWLGAVWDEDCELFEVDLVDGPTND